MRFTMANRVYFSFLTPLNGVPSFLPSIPKTARLSNYLAPYTSGYLHPYASYRCCPSILRYLSNGRGTLAVFRTPLVSIFLLPFSFQSPLPTMLCNQLFCSDDPLLSYKPSHPPISTGIIYLAQQLFPLRHIGFQHLCNLLRTMLLLSGHHPPRSLRNNCLRLLLFNRKVILCILALIK